MQGIGHRLRAHASRRRLDRRVAPAARALLGAGFGRHDGPRVLILHHPNRICWASIHPYFHHGAGIAAIHGADIRARPIADLLEDRAPAADIVLVQPWFTEDIDRLAASIERYRDRHAPARVVFLDSFAHVDLRFGRILEPLIDLYLRKALFRDRRDFLRPRLGDTNLTEYYMQLHDIPGQVVDWQVPPALLDRLGLIPNFLTAPHLMPHFTGSPPAWSDWHDRPIDLHARIATKGTPWYQAMREDAARITRDLPGIATTPQARIDQHLFLDEMRQSRLCWSPFGYGELCWRDIEAFMTGAVLIKPDMSHLDSLPDLYRPHETYLPVRWDFSDFEEVARNALADPAAMRHMAETAFAACREYLEQGRFVDDFAILLDDHARPERMTG
ncbi:glycosyltransferase family 1 protein [Paracoccus sp. 1_MG-2023]|uniref:glycosyltransferase family 1 protein n=1 Tax=unclassified Paracoccus (in: a-proteobacteria) TaxID=2688777 RepID=UPI001C08FC40|nr:MULTISPECIES: glycosyltransferase family 1 protein [unclassified Paracoccus (in: a-proteobacteria)]MBU2958944.1 glycosyltransferase family 1 protein [Paracoccus sp. C2R09]MDO6669966.1 glycosyltransferase family 1 protein [Paracoccus sp. 1_MG-2023]